MIHFYSILDRSSENPHGTKKKGKHHKKKGTSEEFFLFFCSVKRENQSAENI